MKLLRFVTFKKNLLLLYAIEYLFALIATVVGFATDFYTICGCMVSDGYENNVTRNKLRFFPFKSWRADAHPDLFTVLSKQSKSKYKEGYSELLSCHSADKHRKRIKRFLKIM